MNIVKIFEVLFCTGILVLASRYYLHMFQQEHYQTEGYIPWIKKHKSKFLANSLIFGIGLCVVYFIARLLVSACLPKNSSIIADLVAAVIALAGLFGGHLYTNRVLYSEPVKKPLVFTARMKRLTGALALVTFVAALLLCLIGIPPYVLFIALPWLVLIASYVISPVEKRIYKYYIDDAKSVLAKRKDLLKIGITGSFGKTSVKMLLKTVLSEKFDVIATPGSENVPMSLSRLIREKLQPQHEVFIAEMGARNFGDIAELCDLVHPQYGILTSVGAQHLEKFGSIENVAKAKNELIENLPADGCAFFAADDAWCDKLFEQAKVEKYRAGIASGYLSFYAENIRSGSFGCRFTLCDSEGGRAEVEMKLLGKHNVANALLVASVARKMGMTLQEIARGLAKAEPVEHRLQLMNNPGGMTIIDDAFNSNPIGAKNALEVLRDFPGRRVIVTPGMVEQGAFEEELNHTFGTQLVGCCDIAILVGKGHVQPIKNGALSAGFDRDSLYVVDNISQAQKLLGQIASPYDVVLFENDLTDNYNE